MFFSLQDMMKLGRIDTEITSRRICLVRYMGLFTTQISSMGGLGIINKTAMNKCLIIKWLWRIVSTDPDTMWLKILKAKYIHNSSPMFASAVGGSQFWKSLVKVRDDSELM